ncbi:hypothetical protein [Sphingomonas xanthus]|uniref:Uncharacterized protein n=1 Tax=Sphingomonas xanthus TaxID=2594473 RepID=A0A516IQM6_9SPHN|nr:hypothetical protein [Sphingomonas xanthus]QDP19196.1 hypothetical protein FMM02_03990 [Sphingomonas xanthus]
MFTLYVALALAAPNPGSIDAPRKAYASCLKNFESNQLKAKVAVDAYEASVKTACSGEAAAFTAALVAYDTAMGTKRANATANAARDVEDYQLTSVDRYRDLLAN